MTETVSIPEIKERLAERCVELAEYLFGKPTRRWRHELRFGSRGSLNVTISGPKRGYYYSHEEQAGGSMLDAIMLANGYDDVRPALDWAKDYLGIRDDRPLPPRPKIRYAPDGPDPSIERQQQARRLWAAGVSVGGTLGETYLRTIRGIRSSAWPDCIRWHAGKQCLLFAATDTAGSIMGIQRIFLMPDGNAKTREDGGKLKVSLGPVGRGAVRMTPLPDSGNAIVLAEGPETGLSVWYATGMETRVLLGSIARTDLSDISLDRTIIIAADDDARNAPSRRALNKTINSWRREGRTVLATRPNKLSQRDKSDFNDLLRTGGIEAVQEQIRPLAVEARAGIEPLLWDRNIARAKLKDAFATARSRLVANQAHNLKVIPPADGDPPAVAIQVDGGLGKTREGIKLAIRQVKEGRGSVTYAVPTHKLGNELKQRFEKEDPGIAVDIWRGRKADDPDSDGDTMCRDLDAVLDVQSLSGDVQKLACEGKDASGQIRRCPHFDSCAYQAQRHRQADIWIVAHNLLFSKKPAAITQPGLVIIDESFTSAAMQGVTGRPKRIGLADIAERPVARKSDGDVAFARSADLDASLKPARDALAAVLGSHPEGPIERQRLIEGGLTEDMCREAASAEWWRKQQLDKIIWPGMPQAARRSALAAAQPNMIIARMARMWHVLADMLKDGGPEHSGRVAWRVIKDDDGASHKALTVAWLDTIKDGWTAPTLHIDATLRIDLVRHIFPQIELLDRVTATAPDQHTVQYVGKSFSKSALKEDKEIDKAFHWAVAHGRRKGGEWLLAVQKDVEESIRARHDIPAWMDLAHHNNIAGRDEWRDVRGLIVIGRTMPRPIDVEQIAGVLTGSATRDTGTEDHWYPTTDVVLAARSGKAVTVEKHVHPDPLAEQVRASICEDQIQQIIWRGRGVNRSAGRPLDVVILGDCITAQPDEIENWRWPSLDDKIFAQKGVWLESVAHVSRTFPLLTGNIERIKKARQRLGTLSYKDYYRKTSPTSSPHICTVFYRLSGPGQRRHQAIFDKRDWAEQDRVKGWLEDKLGALASFEVSGFEPPTLDPTRHQSHGLIAATSAFEGQRSNAPGEGGFEPPAPPSTGYQTHGLIPATSGVTGQRSNAPGAPGFEPGISDRSFTKGVLPNAQDPPLDAWNGGHLTANQAQWAQDRLKSTAQTQEDVARAAGLSRPQLTNALRGRFGLSEAAARRVYEVLNALPVVQPGLGFT